MRNRFFTAAAVLFALTLAMSACAGGEIYTEADTYGDGAAVVIRLEFNRQGGFASNQFAVWIEDMDGGYVTTVYATRWTAGGGYELRPESIPRWVEKSGLASLTPEQADAVSGATPATGDHSFVWDLTDMDGNRVPAGEYRFLAEGSLRWNNRVLYAGIINVGGGADHAEAEAEYFFEGSGDRPALDMDAGETAMLPGVAAEYIPDSR